MINTKAILKYIDDNKDSFIVNKNLFDIMEGQLYDKVALALQEAYLSDSSYNVAKRQIAPVNVIKQIVDKLSKIYSVPVARNCDNPTDQELVDYYVDEMKLDSQMSEVNTFYNAMRSAAIEPFLDKRKPQLRVLAPYQFIPYSSDVVNPLNVDTFIKIINEDVIFVYTVDEFIAMDGEGKILPQYNDDGLNPFNIIPQTYISKSKHLLIPNPDKDLLQFGIIYNVKIANLLFAIQYQTNSLMYTIDVNVEQIELNPNSFTALYTTEEGKKPEIGVIKPEVDIDQVSAYLDKLTEQFLNSRNLKGTNSGTDSAVSGVALQIKNIDTTDDRKEQIVYFTDVEKELWGKIKIMHNYWADAGLIDEPRKFSEEFKPSITFATPKPIESQMEIVTRNKELLDAGLVTKELAMQEIYPEKDQEEIKKLLEEIESETEITVNVNETPDIQNQIQDEQI